MPQLTPLVDAWTEPKARTAPYPAIGAWIAVSGGFVAARYGPTIDATWWLGAGAILAVAAALLRGGRALVLLAIAAVLISAGYFSWRLLEPKSELALTGDRAIVTVDGVALNHPESGAPNPGLFARFVYLPPVARFRVQAERVIDGAGAHELDGVMYVRVAQPVADVFAGDRVRLTGYASAIEPPSNPGGFDSILWARQANVIGRLSIATRAGIEVIDDDDSPLMSQWLRWKADLRARASAWLNSATMRHLDNDSRLNDAARATVAALLLGAREDAAVMELSDAMQRLGVTHLMAISGMHLGVLVWCAVIGLRSGMARAGVESVVVAAVILLYMTLVPANTPIVRAGLMALIFLGADASGRRYHPIAVLAWASVAVLIWRPLDLWSPGYQLSFGVVAAIMTLPRFVHHRLHPIDIDPDEMTTRRRVVRRIEQMLTVGLCAWAVATPVVIYHFGVLSLFGALATIVLFPFVVVVIGVGAAALMLAALIPNAAAALGAVLALTGDLLVRTTLALDALPLTSVYLPPVSLKWTVVTLALTVWLILYGDWRRVRDWLVAAALVGWAASFALVSRLEPGTAPHIDTLDVDDGACHVIRSGDEALLWDAGSRRLWLGERELPSALRALGAWPVRTIVLSHPNLDHYAAIPHLVAPLGVRTLLVSAATLDEAASDPAGPVAFLLESMRQRGVPVRVIGAGETLKFGDATVTFLHPAQGAMYEEGNDNSLTALFTAPTEAGERAALFCGDIERDAMEAITATHPDLRADVMEAPHHGSARREAMRFVERVDPAIVIQSTGPSRVNDDRWDATRDGRVWMTTAVDGWIHVEIDRDGTIRVDGMFSDSVTLGALPR